MKTISLLDIDTDNYEEKEGDKIDFLNKLLKTEEYYYSKKYLFILIGGKLKYFCDYFGSTTFYDIEKRESYNFNGFTFFNDHNDFLLKKNDDYDFTNFIKSLISDDYIVFESFFFSCVFKKGNPRCNYFVNRMDETIGDYIQGEFSHFPLDKTKIFATIPLS